MLSNEPAVPAIKNSGIAKKDVALTANTSSTSSPGISLPSGPWNIACTPQSPSMFGVYELLYAFVLGTLLVSVSIYSLCFIFVSGSFHKNVTPVTVKSVVVAVAVISVPGSTSTP